MSNELKRLRLEARIETMRARNAAAADSPIIKKCLRRLRLYA